METVTLKSRLGEQEFTLPHARKLMGMVNNGGWKFKTKKDEAKVMGNKDKSKKTQNNGSGNTGNQGNSESAKEQEQDSEGDKS